MTPRAIALAAFGAVAAPAAAEPVLAERGLAERGLAEPAMDPRGDVVAQCLTCHRIEPDRIDIVGLRALSGLPPEWPYLFEDAFDLDGDGVAGAMRFVSGPDRPLMGKFGRALSAGRFEDFALIAASAHGLTIADADEMAAIRAAFEARSPEPVPPDAAAVADFEARGCAACHVTRTYAFEGATYMPLSDFLLHDLGEGPVRTQPLWGCPSCLTGPGHVDAPGAR